MRRWLAFVIAGLMLPLVSLCDTRADESPADALPVQVEILEGVADGTRTVTAVAGYRHRLGDC